METLSPFAFVTLVTLISGAGGTGLGGLIGALFKSESNRTISLLLAFAGGVMTAMVCFDLLAEAEEAAGQIAEHGVLLVILAVALGVAVVYLLNHLIDRKTRKEVSHTADAHHPETHDDIDELVHADHLNMHKRHNDSKLSLFVAGVVMACAIALHNIPEGMTIGASFAVSDNLMWGTGMIMAVLIGLHNIPEGMAVAVPLMITPIASQAPEMPSSHMMAQQSSGCSSNLQEISQTWRSAACPSARCMAKASFCRRSSPRASSMQGAAV